jgi:hypothetical protein
MWDRTASIFICSLTLALFGFYLAIMQIKASRQITRLDNISDIIEEASRILENAKAEVICLLGNPALGASSNPVKTKDFIRCFEDRIDKGSVRVKILCYSLKDVQDRLWGDLSGGVTGERTKYVTEQMFRAIDKGQDEGWIEVYYRVYHSKLTMVHMLLCDTDDVSKACGMIWFCAVDPQKPSEVHYEGFVTKEMGGISAFVALFNEVKADPNLTKGSE